VDGLEALTNVGETRVWVSAEEARTLGCDGHPADVGERTQLAVRKTRLPPSRGREPGHGLEGLVPGEAALGNLSEPGIEELLELAGALVVSEVHEERDRDVDRDRLLGVGADAVDHAALEPRLFSNGGARGEVAAATGWGRVRSDPEAGFAEHGPEPFAGDARLGRNFRLVDWGE
jgi:hypothetical protein